MSDTAADTRAVNEWFLHRGLPLVLTGGCGRGRWSSARRRWWRGWAHSAR